MKIIHLVTFWAVCGLCVSAPALAESPDDKAWHTLLEANVKGSQVNYAGFVKNQDFTKYVKAIGETDPAKLSDKNAQLAFWINAYNALTIHSVLKHWPDIKSVSTIYPKFAFFDRKDQLVGGKKLSLNQIENEIIRPQFKDPRIHAALNCASVSCPPLQNYAFTGANLDKQLDKAFKSFANDSQRNAIDEASGQVRLSQIFNWYKVDFESGGGPAKYIAQFIDDGKRKDILLKATNIGFLNYDWNLNKTP